MERKTQEKQELDVELEKIREELKNLKEYLKGVDDEKAKERDIQEKIQKKRDLLENRWPKNQSNCVISTNSLEKLQSSTWQKEKEEEEEGKEVSCQERNLLSHISFLLQIE